MSTRIARIAFIVLACAPLDPVQVLTGGVRQHAVAPGDTLVSIGARAGIEAATLAADNNLPIGARLQTDHLLRIDNRHVVPRGTTDGVLINIPQRMAFLFSDGRVIASYPITAGSAGWPTPVGAFEIEEKEIDPTWDVPPSIQREMAQQGKPVVTRMPPGPANPLGDRFLRVRGTGIGLHGTNAPTGLYRLTSHGCIRLHPDDIRDLFDRVDVGTGVRIIYEPVLTAQDADGRVWLEVHRDAYGRAGRPLEQALALLDAYLPLAPVDVDRILDCVTRRAGRACDITAGAR